MDIFSKNLISTLEITELHKVSEFPKFLELPNVC